MQQGDDVPTGPVQGSGNRNQTSIRAPLTILTVLILVVGIGAAIIYASAERSASSNYLTKEDALTEEDVRRIALEMAEIAISLAPTAVPAKQGPVLESPTIIPRPLPTRGLAFCSQENNARLYADFWAAIQRQDIDTAGRLQIQMARWTDQCLN